jgi:hypothetical protein
MVIVERLLVAAGIASSLFIILANYFQWKIRRRFSGVIGKIMFWYSLGLGAMLALTIWNWIVAMLEIGMAELLWGDLVFFLIASFFFFMGSIVIR